MRCRQRRLGGLLLGIFVLLAASLIVDGGIEDFFIRSAGPNPDAISGSGVGSGDMRFAFGIS
jgi:hypothetical protein